MCSGWTGVTQSPALDPLRVAGQVQQLAEVLGGRQRLALLGQAVEDLVSAERDDVFPLCGGDAINGLARVCQGIRSLVPDLRAHLDKYTEDKPNALVFSGIKGGPLRR